MIVWSTGQGPGLPGLMYSTVGNQCESKKKKKKGGRRRIRKYAYSKSKVSVSKEEQSGLELRACDRARPRDFSIEAG